MGAARAADRAPLLPAPRREAPHLGRRERSDVPAREVGQPERPDPHPDESPDGRPDLPEHPPQLALPALVDRDPHPRGTRVHGGLEHLREQPVLGVGLPPQAVTVATPSVSSTPASSASACSRVSGRARPTAYSRSTW